MGERIWSLKTYLMRITFEKFLEQKGLDARYKTQVENLNPQFYSQRNFSGPLHPPPPRGIHCLST